VGAKQDYKELVPVGPLSQPVGDAIRRGALANALAQITAKKGGETGLYDSVMAAYQAQRASYTPNKVNSVVVFTDGKNNDPSGGLSLSQLLAQLKQLSDPKRPLPVFIIAFGRQTDVDMPTMRKIAAVTRGAAYNANTPAEINKVFLDAVGLRTCRPDC